MPRQTRTNSRAASQASQIYFQGLSTAGMVSSSVDQNRSSETSIAGSSRNVQYSTPSATSTRPSTSQTWASQPISRPSTATGRRSRATHVSSILGAGEAHSVVCAISEARGVTPTVGLAIVNVSLGEVTLSQICDNQSYVKTIHKIQIASPSRIVFMSSACPPNKPSTLYALVHELVPEAQVDALDRSAWSEASGFKHIQNLAFESDIGPIEVAIKGKYYATSSFAAVCTPNESSVL